MPGGAGPSPSQTAMVWGDCVVGAGSTPDVRGPGGWEHHVQIRNRQPAWCRPDCIHRWPGRGGGTNRLPPHPGPV